MSFGWRAEQRLRRQAEVDRRRRGFVRRDCSSCDARICRDADAYPRDIHRVNLQRRYCMHDSHVHRRLYVGRLPGNFRSHVRTWECGNGQPHARAHGTTRWSRQKQDGGRSISPLWAGGLAVQPLQSSHSPCRSLSIGNSYRYWSIIALLSYGLHKTLNESLLNPSMHAVFYLVGSLLSAASICSSCPVMSTLKPSSFLRISSKELPSRR